MLVSFTRNVYSLWLNSKSYLEILLMHTLLHISHITRTIVTKIWDSKCECNTKVSLAVYQIRVKNQIWNSVHKMNTNWLSKRERDKIGRKGATGYNDNRTRPNLLHLILIIRNVRTFLLVMPRIPIDNHNFIRILHFCKNTWYDMICTANENAHALWG